MRLARHSADPHRELQDLNIVAHGEDPTRPTIAATCISDLPQMNKIPDLLGWNIYPGWYSGWGTKEDFGTSTRQTRGCDSRSRRILHQRIRRGRERDAARTKSAAAEDRRPMASRRMAGHPPRSRVGGDESAAVCLGHVCLGMFDFAVSTRHEGGMPGLQRQRPRDARPQDQRRTRFIFTKRIGRTNRCFISPAAVSLNAPTR